MRSALVVCFGAGNIGQGPVAIAIITIPSSNYSGLSSLMYSKH